MDLEFLRPLADFYFSLEDKWYDFWEKAGEKFPNLGLMDKIEKIDNFFPSFQLFLVFLFLLLAGITGLFFFFGLHPAEAMFKVVDKDSVVLGGVLVQITDGAETKNFTSDLFGEFSAQLNSKTVKVTADLNGYTPFSSEITVSAGENLIVLEKQGVEFDKKLVTVVDEKNLVLKQPVTASFSCSGQSAPPSPMAKNSGDEFEVPFLKECGALTVQIDSAGYNSASKVLESYRTTIPLSLKNIPTGEIIVQVRFAATNALISNITVTLFKATTIAKTNEGRTDASGSYSFRAAPGTYYVSAKDHVLEKYSSGQSDSFEVVAGETKNVQILLTKNVGAKTRLFLKFSGSDSMEAISGVKADLFDGNFFEDSATSNEDGTVSFRNLNEDKNYTVVATHKDYVTNIIDSPALVEDDEMQATEVLLSKADSGNSGTVRVMVLSVEPAKNLGIALAVVALYNSGHNFPILTGKTDSNGNTIFSNMPADSYHARAENASQSGESPTKTLLNGSEIFLPINFVLKKSFLRVKTLNEKGENLSGTNLKFIDSTTLSILKEASTGPSGQSDKIEFPWNAKFFISASAPGYLMYNTKIFSLVPDNSLEVQIVMIADQLNSEFTVKLVDVMDSSAEKSARSFERAKKYFLKFNLVVPQGGFSGIETVARTGLEANLDSMDDNFFITGIVKGNLLVSGTLSKCFDRSSDFADCSPADTNSKMAHLNFGSLPKGVYEYLIEVFVSPKTEAGGKIELRFGAIATQNQSQIRKPQEGLFFKGYTLGGPIFCVRGTANCPNFGFYFTLTDNSRKQYPQPININPSDTVDLSQQATYKLGYTIWNWDAFGTSFNNPVLSFADELSTGALEIVPLQVTLGLIEVDTSFQGPPVDLSPIKEASSVSVRASLAVDRPDNSELLKFHVLATNNLKLVVQPASLAENSVNIVTVKVTDAATDKNVNTAIVKASLANDFSSIIAMQETVSGEGVYPLELPPMSGGQSIFIKAEAFNYNPSDATELKVESGVKFSPHTTQDFDCISVDSQQLTILHKENGEFKISAQNCPKKVDFYLYQPTQSDPLSLEKLSDLTAITNAVTPSFSLNESDSIDVRVSADKLLGEYGVIVQARFDGEQEFQDVSRITVIVQPKSIAEGYCFEIDKTSFLVKPTDTGKITNRCAVNPIDAFLPALSLQNPKASLDTENLQLFPQQQFKWTTDLEGTLGPELGKSRQFTEHLDAPESNDTGSPPKINLVSVLTTAVGTCLLLGKSLPPAIIPVCIYFTASSAISQQLGPAKVDEDCAHCQFRADPEPQTFLFGTSLQSVQIKDITFDDGGWVAFNDQKIQIPQMAPPPTGNEQAIASPQQDSPSNQTGFVLPQIGGSGGWMQIIQMFSSFLTSTGSNNIQYGTDSCTGFDTESTHCTDLPESQQISNAGLISSAIGGYCVNIEPAPIDVTDKFKTGLNTYQLFECNKFNDGFAEFTLDITDSVSQKNSSQQVSFAPLKDTITEAGTVSTDLAQYLELAPHDAFLSLAVANDSQGKIASWMQEDKKIKAMYFVEPKAPSAEKTFEIKNLEIEGEEYATLTITDLVSGTQPPKLDIIFVVDTSTTMGAEKAAFCEKMDLIDSQLKSQGLLDIVSKAYAIGGTDTAISCATESADWGDSQVSADTLPHDAKKAWGPALQDAISKTPWRDGAKRVAVIVADDGVLGNSAQNQQGASQTQSSQPAQVQPQQPQATQPQGSQPITPEVPLENTSLGGVLSNTVNLAIDQNVAVSAMFGVPFFPQISDIRQIVTKTNGFMKSFEPPNSDEKFFSNQLLKTAFETRSETFHIRLEGALGGICRGANDQIGVTGPNGLPRVKLDWSWSAIGADMCNLGNEGYVYCDAVQLTKEIVKRLSLVRQKAQDGDYAVNDLLTFKAFLIKDSYSENFTNAFNSYVMEKELLPLEDYKTDWSKYVSDPSKFAFRSETAPIDPIPSTGLYKVNIVPHFPAGKAWKFFEGNQPAATIEINLDLDQEILQTNPFYYLPFDGAVGLSQDSQSLQRNGYGAGYFGTDLKVIGESENTQEIRTFQTSGNTVASLYTTIENRFDFLNKGETRGQLLSVSGGSGNYSMVFSPSVATPVAMEIIGTSGNANGLFELREGDNVVPVQGSYSLWTGAGSSIGTCNDFAGQELKRKQADSPALGATCQFRENASADKSHGFAWANGADGTIALKTIFYTPNADYKIRNACTTDALIISPNRSSSSSFVPLDFGSDTRIQSLKDLFDLVSNGQACIGESGNSVQFFWNEAYLQRQLKNTVQPEFDRLAQEKGFSVCAVG